LFYSTPARYFNALNERIIKENISIPEYSDKDFFPYADKPKEYWTGYFTSRPYLKGIIRDAGNYLVQTSQFLFNFLLRSSHGRLFVKGNLDEKDKNKNFNLDNYNDSSNLNPKNGLKEKDFGNKNNINKNYNYNNDNNVNENNNVQNNFDVNAKSISNNFVKDKFNSNPNDFSNTNVKPKIDNNPFSNEKGENMLPIFIKKLDEMRRELAIAQHHDSVTGTARSVVSDDYIERLGKGISSLSDIIKTLLIKENALLAHISPENFMVCLDSVAYLSCVEKVFEEGEIQKGILLTTLNPGFEGKYPKKIKVNLNLNSEFLSNISKRILLKKFKANFNHEINRNNIIYSHEELEYDMFFDEKSNCYFIYYVLEFSKDLVYYNILLQFAEANLENEKLQNKIIKPEHINLLGITRNIYKVNDYLEFYLADNKINFTQKIKPNSNPNKNQNTNKKNFNNNTNNNDKIPYNQKEQEYFFSISHAYFTYIPSSRNSQGAYLMATNTERPEIFALNYEQSLIIVGKLVTQINLRFEFSSLLIRIYNLADFPEKSFTFEVESILHKFEPKNSQKEFLLMLNSNIANLCVSANCKGKPEFFTDSNAMRILKRVANTRETFELDRDEEKVAGNFYPVNSVVFIQDSDLVDNKNNNNDHKSLFLFNDRAQGAASLAEGEILININRWSDKDDNRGLADGLNELQSSRKEFTVTHLLALSHAFDYESLKGFVDKKPLTAVFFDYFGSEENNKNNRIANNNRTLRNLNYENNNYIVDNTIKKQEKNILRNLEFNNFDLKRNMIFGIEDLFEIGNKKCFEINYYFISERKVLVQFYNKSDPNLFAYTNCSIKSLNNPHINFSKYTLNGVEKKNKQFYGKDFFKKRVFISLDSLTDDSLFHEIVVPQQDFETFLVEF
jgi:hypothetical protein